MVGELIDLLLFMQQEAAKSGKDGATLSSLSTYLLLTQAEERYNWTPEKASTQIASC